MPTISDKQLRATYSSFEAQHQADPTMQIDANSMLKLLAGVADNNSADANKMLVALTKDGITRDQQLALVKAGLSQKEKKDLITMLDKGTVPMTDEVRKFISQVVGREEPTPNDGALRIDPSQAGGFIKGTVAAGTTIEAINLSTAPEARLHQEDTFVLAKADDTGHFSGKVPDIKEGDLIRMRTRDAQGTVGNWITIRAKGLSPTDTRNTQVAVFRIGLTDNKDGTVAVENINASRPITEPGAQLMFVNSRTGAKTTVTMDDMGNLPKDLKLQGRGGDTFSIRGSDGVNNKDFSAEAGTVTVPGGTTDGGGGVKDLPDPALHKDELNADGTPRFGKKRFTGPLYKDDVHHEDVRQGQLGNCYFPSALSGIAKFQPQALKDSIKDNGDGTYTVTFKKVDYNGKVTNHPVTVDADLYVRAWGGPLYGSSSGLNSPDKMELWYPIIEKAFAAWKGSYDTIGRGGVSSDVMEAILGRKASYMSARGATETAVWNRIKTSIDKSLPVSAGTYGESESARYTNTGVYANHSYSVLGYEETGGQKYVLLRNPWGESEPLPGDGKNDGIFKLKLSDFMKLYQSVMTVS